ncbi:MAG: ribonuclease P protein component [Litorivicinaceae bacterium]
MAVQSLPSRKEFDFVFANPDVRVSSRDFLVLACQNQSTLTRIGFVTSKKKLKLAVTRNRFRRCFRESARRISGLTGLDIVVVARQSPNELFTPTFSHVTDTALEKLARKRNEHSSSHL